MFLNQRSLSSAFYTKRSSFDPCIQTNQELAEVAMLGALDIGLSNITGWLAGPADCEVQREWTMLRAIYPGPIRTRPLLQRSTTNEKASIVRVAGMFCDTRNYKCAECLGWYVEV
jgi:hypothetical protein